MNIADLNPRYSFSSFVVGANNKLAYRASMEVAKFPGSYNPLFICGDTGLGKTHLMHSVARYILESNPKTKVLYITSEGFIYEVINAIRTNTVSEFRAKYLNLDVLLIDDVQYISGKESSLKEFSHAVNNLYNDGKQIVISANCSPRELDWKERIWSRLELQGLVADIESPDFETRIDILQKKLENGGYHFNRGVIEYIARNVKSNIREQEGALKKVIALSEIQQIPPNLELAQRVVNDIIRTFYFNEIIVQMIPCIVAAYYRCTLSELQTSHRNGCTSRSRELFIGKIVGVMLFRKFTSLPYFKIAPLTGFSSGAMLAHFMLDCKEFIQEKCMADYLYLSDIVVQWNHWTYGKLS